MFILEIVRFDDWGNGFFFQFCLTIFIWLLVNLLKTDVSKRESACFLFVGQNLPIDFCDPVCYFLSAWYWVESTRYFSEGNIEKNRRLSLTDLANGCAEQLKTPGRQGGTDFVCSNQRQRTRGLIYVAELTVS